MLCSIAVACEGMGGEPDDSGLSEDEAVAALEIVLAHERVIEQRLSDLKQSNPYALKEKLEDGVWVVKRTSELKAQVEQQKAVAHAYDERFRALMERNGDGC